MLGFNHIVSNVRQAMADTHRSDL